MLTYVLPIQITYLLELKPCISMSPISSSGLQCNVCDSLTHQEMKDLVHLTFNHTIYTIHPSMLYIFLIHLPEACILQ